MGSRYPWEGALLRGEMGQTLRYRDSSAMNCAKTFEINKMPLGIQGTMYYVGCTLIHLVNTTESSVCGSNAALCQITLTTCYCYYYYYYYYYWSIKWQHKHNDNSNYCNWRPGNWEGLFLFQHFINLSLTHLLMTITHLLTAPGPTWKHSHYVHLQLPVPILFI